VAAWRRHLAPGLALSVNVAARQLAHPGFVTTVEKASAAGGLPLNALIIEVTESALLDDASTALDSLPRIRESGARVAIDDFGTGYSSLSYLSRLPADVLKIDRAFVADIDDDDIERGVPPVVLRLGDTLGLETIAEGVETEGQLDALRRLGCRLAQGYLLAEPLGPHAFEAWMTGPSAIDGGGRSARSHTARALGRRPTGLPTPG
jgi:EAL domain-containing protein (putative c-di-GMP-specific phosphodiesterase class I)